MLPQCPCPPRLLLPSSHVEIGPLVACLCFGKLFHSPALKHFSEVAGVPSILQTVFGIHVVVALGGGENRNVFGMSFSEAFPGVIPVL